jgi:hypothetical protein
MEPLDFLIDTSSFFVIFQTKIVPYHLDLKKNSKKILKN